MYCMPNFKTKKALKQAVTDGQRVTIFQPGGMFHPAEEKANYTGTALIEGPHYPAPHTWYASVSVENGKVVKVR